jgi:hypothetical protein
MYIRNIIPINPSGLLPAHLAASGRPVAGFHAGVNFGFTAFSEVAQEFIAKSSPCINVAPLADLKGVTT